MTEASNSEEFGRRVANALTSFIAVEKWESAHGVVLDEPIRIACPNCQKEDALKFARSTNHLYLQCVTDGCLPLVRANCRGCRR